MLQHTWHAVLFFLHLPLSTSFKLHFHPPTLVGESGTNQSCVTSGGPTPQHPNISWSMVPCHFWFPSSSFVVGTSDADSIWVQTAQQGGDPSGPAPAPMVLMASIDGGKSYSPASASLSETTTLIPETRWYRHRTSHHNFTTMSGFNCTFDQCLGNVTQWHAHRNPPPHQPVVELTHQVPVPIAVSGVPTTLQRAWIIMSTKLADGSVLAITNGVATDALHECSSCANPICKADGVENRGVCSGLYLFACPDPVHRPAEWVYRSRITYAPVMSGWTRPGYTVGGLCEPDLVQLADGRVLAVFRLDANTGHWAALSHDGGRTWRDPFPTNTWAVAPKLVALPSGAVVMTSGRPALGAWVTSGDDLSNWTFYNVAKVHNGGVTDSQWLYPPADVNVSTVLDPGHAGPMHARYMRSTTAYNSLMALSNTTLLLGYDRLAHGWKGPPSLNGSAGPLGYHDRIFTMRIEVEP
jgi:hypothetical protein